MKYLTFLIALLLSTPTFAQELPQFIEGQKPVLCAPLNVILSLIERFDEKLFSHWTDSDNTTIVMMYKSENSVTVIETFQTGTACVISTGKDIEIYDETLKKTLTFKTQDVIYNR